MEWEVSVGAGGRAEVKIARLSYQITVTKPIFKWAWPRGSESRPQHTSAASILLSAPTSPCDVRHVGRTSVSPNPSHRLLICFPSSARNLSPQKTQNNRLNRHNPFGGRCGYPSRKIRQAQTILPLPRVYQTPPS